MTREEKQLLLIDLCAREPYHPRINVFNQGYEGFQDGEFDTSLWLDHIDAFRFDRIEILPYLRPMSSMTKEEKEELESISSLYFNDALDAQIRESLKGENKDGSRILEYVACTKVTDWLLEHHFDIHGLIEKGLAIEATEEMYNFKK